jgi:hypothetical protein
MLNLSTATRIFVELLRCVIAAGISYAALAALRHYASSTSRSYELALLLIAGLLWTGISILVLSLTGSTLASQLIARFTNWSAADVRSDSLLM